MIHYSKTIVKSVEKGKIPSKVLSSFHNVFMALDKSKDMNLFDIKAMKTSDKNTAYRVRKGKYRAIFRMQDELISVLLIGKREEVYKLWEQQQLD